MEQRIDGIDFRSAEWAAIRKTFIERIQLAHAALATPMLDEREADMLRGEIKLCQAVIALDEERPTLPSDIYR